MLWVLLAAVATWLALVPVFLVWSNRAAIPPARPLGPWDHAPPATVVVFGSDPGGLLDSARDAAASVRTGDLQLLLVGVGRAAAVAAEELASVDPRFRPLAHVPAGPDADRRAAQRGGKAAANDEIVFLRAGTRLPPTGIARLLVQRRQRAVHLLSALPIRRRADAIGRLLLPMETWLAHGLLPLGGRFGGPIQAVADPALVAVSKAGWQDAGGHGVALGPHDGIALARAFRRRGLRTGLIDGAGLCWTRAPRGLPGALATFDRIVDSIDEGRPALIALLLAQIVPFALLALGPELPDTAAKLAFTGVAAVWIARLLLCFRRGSPVLSAFGQPLAAAIVLSRVLRAR